MLTEVVDRYNKAYLNVEAKCFLELTKPTDALMQHATEAQPVVVGTRGRHALSSAILGSTGLNMLHHSRVPVMICPALDAGAAGKS